MIKPIVTCVAVLTALSLLTGCEENDRAAALMKNPETTAIGVYDDCAVSYVNRGYQVNSFYIAKCSNTTTTTNNFHQQSGKTQAFRHSVVITQEIEKLQAEKSQSEAKEKALEKLSPAERKALGL